MDDDLISLYIFLLSGGWHVDKCEEFSYNSVLIRIKHPETPFAKRIFLLNYDGKAAWSLL